MKKVLIALLLLTAVLAESIHRVELLGIEPNSGPLSGHTRILVRGSQLSGMEAKYPNPKCKFGRDDKVVDASYVKCTPEPMKVWEMEAPTSAKTDT